MKKKVAFIVAFVLVMCVSFGEIQAKADETIEFEDFYIDIDSWKSYNSVDGTVGEWVERSFGYGVNYCPASKGNTIEACARWELTADDLTETQKMCIEYAPSVWIKVEYFDSSGSTGYTFSENRHGSGSINGQRLCGLYYSDDSGEQTSRIEAGTVLSTSMTLNEYSGENNLMSRLVNGGYGFNVLYGELYSKGIDTYGYSASVTCYGVRVWFSLDSNFVEGESGTVDIPQETEEESTEELTEESTESGSGGGSGDTGDNMDAIINPDQDDIDRNNQIAGDISDNKQEIDDIIGAMDSVEKPDVNDAFGLVDPEQIVDFENDAVVEMSGLISSVTGNSVVSKYLLLLFGLAFVSFVFFGKKGV